MARSAGRAGCDVSLVVVLNGRARGLSSKIRQREKTPDFFCKYVSEILYAREPFQDELVDVLLRIGSRSDEKIVLLPCDDYAAATIDQNMDSLKDRFLLPNIGMRQGLVEHYMDKSLQKEYASRAGLNVARAWRIVVDGGAYSIPEGIEYPCYVKPENGNDAPKSFAGVCEDNDALNRLMGTVAKRSDCTMLVEEYLDIDGEYGVLGFAVNGEAYIPGIVEKARCGHGHQNGITMVGRVTEPDSGDEFISGVKKLIKEIGFTGLFDVDCCRCDNKKYFIELNLRLGAFGYAITETLVNLPELFINYSIDANADVPRVTSGKTGATLVSEKVVMDDYCSGFLSWSQYKEIVREADYSFLNASDDPEPYRAFSRSIPYMKLKRFGKRVLRKGA